MSEASVLAPIAAAVDLVERQLADDEAQLGLWSTPCSEAGRAKLAERRIGAGRPAGSRNKRTEATVAHLLQRYRDPRAVALERIQMHPADLAAFLGCSLFEASQEQRLYMQAIFPFIHARITPEVIDNRQVIHLTINTGEALGGGAMAGAETSIAVLDPAEYEVVDAVVDAAAAEQPSASTEDKP